MPEDRGENAFRISAGQRVVISMANASGFDFYEHFARFRAFEIDGFNGERSARFPCDSGFGFQGKYNEVSMSISVSVIEFRCRVSLESK